MKFLNTTKLRRISCKAFFSRWFLLIELRIQPFIDDILMNPFQILSVANPYVYRSASSLNSEN